MSGLVEVGNGDVVALSSNWHNVASAANARATTWINCVTGLDGPDTAANSPVGTTPDDDVGGQGIHLLANGNYVATSTHWDKGALNDAGTITFGNGATGARGPVTTSNSSVGQFAADTVVVALTNGITSPSPTPGGRATSVRRRGATARSGRPV